ncbi:MAG: hypothetical protein RIQ90_978 [Bacteroidota bacterium]|jgi:hypothetical protein
MYLTRTVLDFEVHVYRCLKALTGLKEFTVFGIELKEKLEVIANFRCVKLYGIKIYLEFIFLAGNRLIKATED